MLKMTTTQALELFEKALTGNNYSDNTIRAYKDDIDQFLSWVKKNRVDWDNPLRFSRIDIVEFLNHLASVNDTGMTRARKLSSTRNFFKFLKANNIIANNPAETIQEPIKEEKDPEILFRNEYKALLYEAQNSPRDYAMLMVFLQTGVRVGELANLTLSDIDLENKNMVVKQGKGKKDRTIPLEDQATAAISAYLAERDRYLDPTNLIDSETLFLAKNGTSLDVRTIRYMVQKYIKKAGIRKKASVHTLRHTFGSHKVDKGMSLPDLQKLMGHKKMETTFKYVHLARTNLREQQQQTAL